MKTPHHSIGGALKKVGAFLKDGKGAQALFGEEKNRDKPFFERDRYKRAAGSFMKVEAKGIENTGMLIRRQQRMKG